MQKIINIWEQKVLYEQTSRWNLYGDGEVVHILCEEYDIDEEFMLEDMPSILQFILEDKIAETRQIPKNHKTQISIRIFTQDLEFFKNEAEKTGDNYGELIRWVLSEYRKNKQLHTQ